MDHYSNEEPIDKKFAEGFIKNSPNSQTDQSPTTKTLTVAEVEIEILPVVYEIIRCIEKDPADATAKQREAIECSQKILELQKRFESARAQIKLLRGIEYNKEEQLQQLELMRNQLKAKQALIRKYKNHLV